MAGIASSCTYAPSDFDNGRTVAATQFAGAVPKLSDAEGRGSRSVNMQAIQRQCGTDESGVSNDLDIGSSIGANTVYRVAVPLDDGQSYVGGHN